MQFEQIGKYKVLEKIGQGAMGELFRAHDAALERQVAIKVITAKLSDDEDARKRFVREAKAVAALNHPNIITVYDFGEHEGMAFMVMEMLDEGQDLKDLIEQKQLPALEIRIALMEQICDGLAFAHRKGVVHQDIKPGNIRILKNGGVKILDFGLALRKDDTGTGPIMGTPYYMAPEQIRGDRPSARSDIFSLGAVFYEFLSGHRPFTGSNVKAILTAVVQKDAVPLTKLVPDLSPAVSAFVDRALAKNPAGRYADADQMLEALRAAWLEGAFPEAVLAPKDTTAARALGRALSASSDTRRELLAALEDIDQYLADVVPPLFVTDSVAELQGAPVEGTAAELWSWAQRQILAHSEYDLVNLLFYALDKLMAVGMLNLLPRDPLLAFLKQVGEALAQACPPPERERLRRALEHLGKEDSAPQVLMLGQGDEDQGPSTPQSRRLSILEQRIRREGLAKAPGNDPVRRRVIAQALAAAATGARNEEDFARDLRRLRAVGVGGGAGAAFKNLGNGLANWALPRDMGRDTLDVGPAPVELQAMERIVSLSEDPVEVGRRYHHLVIAATEQFNEGNLGGAVQMFDLARKLTDEGQIEPGYVAPIRGRGHEQLNPDRLREYMERPERHTQLRQVMVFFEPGLGVPILLDQIETEERRDRRRLLLDLLVIHGQAARDEAMARLRASVETEVSDFGRRNWIYLLRLVPRSTEEEAEAEVEAVSRFAGPGIPIFLVKEAVTHIGLIRHPSAGRPLVALLERWESYLLRRDLKPESREDGIAALDRLAAALSTQRNPSGWKALIDHALSGKAEFGTAAKRLEELGTQDLSRSPEVVDRLLGEIEDCLPRGVLGRLMGKADQDLPFLVAAVSGTRSPDVQEILEEVAERFEAREAGKAATRVLRAPPPAGPLAGLSGKLDTHGVPALLDHLAKEKATGSLKLRPPAGEAPATVAFVRGRPVSADWSPRKGLPALYQLFQQPLDVSYSFDTTRPRVAAGAPALPDVPELVREGVRRAQELERTRALLPDDTPLEATGSSPTAVPDEPDYELVVSLWQKVCAGVPVGTIEAGLTLDVYRVRHALGHWLEEGALQVTTPPGSAPTSPQAAQPDPGT